MNLDFSFKKHILITIIITVFATTSIDTIPPLPSHPTIVVSTTTPLLPPSPLSLQSFHHNQCTSPLWPPLLPPPQLLSPPFLCLYRLCCCPYHYFTPLPLSSLDVSWPRSMGHQFNHKPDRNVPGLMHGLSNRQLDLTKPPSHNQIGLND